MIHEKTLKLNLVTLSLWKGTKDSHSLLQNFENHLYTQKVLI